jgi:diaminopropionate ammonia-lyase
MAGLAAGEVSLLAWTILETGTTAFMTIEDDAAADAMRALAEGRFGDPHVTAGESAVAGLAALFTLRDDHALRDALGLDEHARVLLIGTEGATDPETYERIVGHWPDR